ncbi:MAG TPA: Crp/Fnr family transcriptional regulator [Candidatus Krumholzibacteria bacterium]
MNTGAAITNTISRQLGRSTLFGRLDPAQLDEIGRNLRVQTYRRRELVYASRRELPGVLILLEGRVKITRADPRTGRELILFIVGPGEVFGMPVTGSQEPTSAVALDQSTVGRMRSADFERLAQSPDFAVEMARITSERLAHVTTRLDEMVFRDVPARLARSLLRLATDFPGDQGGGARIDVRLTQQDLADLIGSTRESASLAVNNFKRLGLIDVRQRMIFIRDTERLRSLTA